MLGFFLFILIGCGGKNIFRPLVHVIKYKSFDNICVCIDYVS